MGLVVVVLSSIHECEAVLSGQVGFSLIGSSGRLPILFFLALSIVQIAAIVSGNEKPILVGNISQKRCKYRSPHNNNLRLCVCVNISIYILGHFNCHARICFLPSIWSDSVKNRCCSTFGYIGLLLRYSKSSSSNELYLRINLLH